MKKITYIQLGATLFIPASHKHLNAVVNENRFEGLKSLVIDFEDGLSLHAFDSAMSKIEGVLENINEYSPLVFLRARNEEHLEALLSLKGITNIQGFVLAKFTLENADRYLELLGNTDFVMMPSIEGSELFDTVKLRLLKERLDTYKSQVLIVRFGLEDMLRQLGMWRECGESIFDFASTSSVLGNFIAIFKSEGFAISGGVYPCYKDDEGFTLDVKRDIKEGLFSKTIIHPRQIILAHNAYRVTKTEVQKAEAIVKRRGEAVFEHEETMAEVVTMLPFAKAILLRRDIYGRDKS